LNIEMVTYRMTGISPLLQNNPEAMVRGGNQGLSKKTIPSVEDEAEKAAYRLPSGQLYIKTLAFRSALLGATTGKRLGKMSAKTILSGSVFVAHEVAPLFFPTPDEPISEYEISVMRAVVQRAGIMRARPKIDKWACDITFEVDRDFIAENDILTQLLADAGRLKGVGDYRPEKSGMYGRFEAELQA
jgi:hypothetical protein